MATLYPPYIIERSSRGERTYDIFSRLLMDRIVFLGAPINDDVANIIIAQLLFLEADNPDKDIYLYINSPGGVRLGGDGDLRHDAVPPGAGEHDLHGHGRLAWGRSCWRPAPRASGARSPTRGS